MAETKFVSLENICLHGFCFHSLNPHSWGWEKERFAGWEKHEEKKICLRLDSLGIKGKIERSILMAVLWGRYHCYCHVHGQKKEAKIKFLPKVTWQENSGAGIWLQQACFWACAFNICVCCLWIELHYDNRGNKIMDYTVMLQRILSEQ